MANNTLAGLRILVTRPRDQAQPLMQAIELAGGIPLLFPLLDIAPVADAAALQQQVLSASQAHLAIFISPNAVQFGMAALRAAGVSLDGVKVATVGKGSAQALRECGVLDVIVPSERFDSEGLLALLPHVDGWRVMILRGDGGRELLGDTLKARGAMVEYVSCYRRSKPQQTADELQALQADVITVTSSEALNYLWQMLDETARLVLRDTPLFAPHPRIAERARQLGWSQVHLTPAGDEGLMAGIQKMWIAKGQA